MTNKCFLKSLDQNVPNVELGNKKKILGRSTELGICDYQLSKNQIIMKPNFNKMVLLLRINGTNPSGMNGFLLESGKCYDAYHGDVIELLYGKYLYKIIFSSEILPGLSQIEKDFKNVYCKDIEYNKMLDIWEIFDSEKLAIYSSPNLSGCHKIASYDLDNTLIKTKSGKAFPIALDDWQLMYPDIPKKLKLLCDDQFKIVIFTNQAGIAKGKVNLTDFKQKIEAIVVKLNVPIQVFISTKKSIYRKPMVGMWKVLEIYKNEGLRINYQKSFFVGDAAGRPEEKIPFKVKKDHSCSDRLMALNIGISFLTPEEHFLNQRKRNWTKPAFEPRKKVILNFLDPILTELQCTKPEIIIMFGLPGCGKSHFSQKFLGSLGYSIINRDTINSLQNCLKLCEDSLKEQKSCVIDNTNLDVTTRQHFITLAKKYSANCKCLIMNVSNEELKHNLAFRDLTDVHHQKINDLIVNSLKKKLQYPLKSEGFDEMGLVNVIPIFRNIEEEDLYRMYLLEK